ncbi:MAG: DUF3302 domain-containing protein [Yokenella regensburgei]|jgi:hypothetical protein|uniref:Inner membrane protein yiaW n=1 Tax=Yokenella regensburgei TaxID=158877 RepID=A0AB38FVF0_9ENTR|nr:DUF3302 domain-containing protein [Yokenella regensburgei]EHM48790.1 hypothetical protein HMPREF0880_02239 [Yokenella regensburgei ATCC 43003]KAF1368937.1 hypothetical protein FHR25_002687 [Yokenella regensburgei]KFD24126.1 GTPase [Yokenella regensburgei ATCC 49455]MDQ4431063.1 DUF3302 domain-containing protein [Yokenella regensburgei]MDR2218677.1 DUF3302 domain-containing protein [Yokenella regensburgei]
MVLDYVALAVLVAVSLILFYGIIAIHDIPYELSKKRNHPHQDAIHYAGWVSLFTLHALWPFLWIWATLWREDRGWGLKHLTDEHRDISQQMVVLHNQVLVLTQELGQLKEKLDKKTTAEGNK